MTLALRILTKIKACYFKNLKKIREFVEGKKLFLQKNEENSTANVKEKYTIIFPISWHINSTAMGIASALEKENYEVYKKI